MVFPIHTITEFIHARLINVFKHYQVTFEEPLDLAVPHLGQLCWKTLAFCASCHVKNARKSVVVTVKCTCIKISTREGRNTRSTGALHNNTPARGNQLNLQTVYSNGPGKTQRRDPSLLLKLYSPKFTWYEQLLAQVVPEDVEDSADKRDEQFNVYRLHVRVHFTLRANNVAN